MKRKPKSERQVLLKDLDDLAKNIVRVRDRFTCQKCGRKDVKSVHHIFSVKYANVRFDTRNLIVLCFPCHLYYAHTKPEQFRDLIIKRIGLKEFEALKARAMTPARYRIGDLRALYLQLLKEKQ
jgi:5-methylcytosine-specific restriction endonuclease McrA